MNASPGRPQGRRPQAEFRLRCDETWAVLTVVGVLEFSDVSELKYQLDHALEQRRDVILDVSQAASVDASAIELIGDMKRLIELFGGRLRVVATSRTPELLNPRQQVIR